MTSSFAERDIIALQDFSKEEILFLLEKSQQIKKEPLPSLLKGKILGSCFYEPSTRTRLSFEAAMHRLGGNVIGFSDSQNISTKKGESLKDTMIMMDHYADVIALRHPKEGAAKLAADSIKAPLINAGDGANQHPTQTFVDLFTIQESQGQLDGLSLAMVGDLKHGRAVHSLARALIPFKCRLFFISPQSLEMPRPMLDKLRGAGVKFSFHQSIDELIHKVDILYITRVQEERFSHRMDFEAVKNTFLLKPEVFARAKKNLKVLHPLPRVNEIDPGVDSTPFAHYFQQAGNGIYVRQALLGLVLGKLQ